MPLRVLIRGWGGLAACALLLLAFAGEGRAQDGRQSPGWSFEGRSGVALSGGGLADVTKPGPIYGIGASYWLSPNVALQADGDVELYNGGKPFGPLQEKGPDVRLWHSTAGVLIRFTEEDVPRWVTELGFGLGAVVFDTEPFLVPTAQGAQTFQLDETYVNSYGRLRIGYTATERLLLYLGVRSHFIVTNTEDTRAFEAATEGRSEAFGVAWTFPIRFGVSVGL